MSNLRSKIQNVIQRYPGAYISGSGKRTIEQQMNFVKSRPSQYPKTLRRVFASYGYDTSLMNDPGFLANVYKGKDQWLRRTILETAKRNEGFQHLSGNAIDVSVRNMDSQGKEKLLAELKKEGYNVIMEHISGSTSKYYVSIDRANVFHVDLLNTNIERTNESATTEKRGPIYKAE